MTNPWEVVNSEPGLWTVGHTSPSGECHPDSDTDTLALANKRAFDLNGQRGEYVYIRTEFMCYTVGYYDGGTWMPHTDCESIMQARAMVCELNGGD